VGPLYTDWPDCLPDVRDAILDAVDAIEAAVLSLSKSEVDFSLLRKALRTIPGKLRPVLEAVIAICNATNAYRQAPDTSFSEAEEWNGRFIWPEAVQAALKAFESGRQIRWHNQEIDISSEIRQDFLIAKAEAESRTKLRKQKGSTFYRKDDRPVHPTLFGLLWPDNPPIGWESYWASPTTPAAAPATPSLTPAVTNPQTSTSSAGASAEVPELLRGRLLKAFQRAIEDAFDQSSLTQLLRHDLGVRLDLIVLGQSFEEIVFRLLTWAEQRGRLRELVKAVALSRDKKPNVQSAANALLQIEL
jgi:hypothetical protein